MLRSLLLVIDRQEADHGSVDLGIRWSQEFDALLIGLGVVDKAVTCPPEPVPLGAMQAKRELDQARLHARQVEIENTLSAVAVRCANSKVAFKPLETVGCASEEVSTESQRFDLVIMGHQHRHAGEQKRRVTDLLRTILRTANRPVVITPQRITAEKPVVVAYDGSVQAARTLFAFALSGLSWQHPVHVVSLHEDPVESARRGNRAAEFLAAHDIQSTLFARTAEDPAAQILQFAEDVNAGLIVLGAYGKSRVHEFFLGSVTASLLARSPLPLFMFH